LLKFHLSGKVNFSGCFELWNKINPLFIKCYLNLLYSINPCSKIHWKKRGAVSWPKHHLNKGMDQNLHTKIVLACIFSSIENRTKFSIKILLLSVETKLDTFHVQNESFSGYIRDSRLALRLNTWNLPHYFQISHVIRQDQNHTNRLIL
jgi:hypothetical protein